MEQHYNTNYSTHSTAAFFLTLGGVTVAFLLESDGGRK
jgi:hypothetical protein